jgi:hypothetical protein
VPFRHSELLLEWRVVLLQVASLCENELFLPSPVPHPNPQPRELLPLAAVIAAKKGGARLLPRIRPGRGIPVARDDTPPGFPPRLQALLLKAGERELE